MCTKEIQEVSVCLIDVSSGLDMGLELASHVISLYHRFVDFSHAQVCRTHACLLIYIKCAGSDKISHILYTSIKFVSYVHVE